jgi:hypothetical protein
MSPGDIFCHSCGWDSRTSPPAPAAATREPLPPDASHRSRLTALLLCLLLGWVGAHRFYVGKIGTGLIWLFSLGIFGIGLIFDLILIATGELRDKEARRLVRWE